MSKVLLAVDGSEASQRATRTLIANAGLYKEPMEVELITVRPPLPPIGGLSGVVVNREMIDSYYREEGDKALAASRELLDGAAVNYVARVLVGDVAPTIVEHARTTGCKMICMGTRGLSAVPNLVLGSVSNKVLHLSALPVLLVP
jgi:nucleotide-binding universal stress UspA family protein